MIFPAEVCIRARSRIVVTSLILGEIRVNNEPWIHRILSHNISGQEDAFRDQVRARDKRCVVSGMVNPFTSRWPYHEAAHIFPFEREDYWREHGYSRWVTNMDDTIGKSTIDSCQNGLLLSKAVLAAFDQYLLSVNPDVSLRFCLLIR